MRLFRKRKEIPPEQPALYFAGWGFDERTSNYIQTDDGAKVLVVKTEWQTFILRKMAAYVCFRRQDDIDESACWFLLEPYTTTWRDDIKDFPPQKLVEALENQAYGRCLAHVAECMQPDQCVYLCFAPDGSGFSIDYTRERMVDFHWQDVTVMTWQELSVADPKTLRPLCQTVFDTLIHPRLTNPYIDPATLVEIPHEFICGSEQELRRLTTIIAQSHPRLFKDDLEPVTVTYRAQTPTKRAYMMQVSRGGEDEYYGEHIMESLGRLQSLCDLALRLNTFTGVKWETWLDTPNRLGHYQKTVRQIRVEVRPPSAHERAESLLSLSDWLTGKVRDEKRLHLLGLE